MTSTVPDGKKTKAELLENLNEERKQVTAHTNLTQNASTNDCVRYFDIGKEKQERDDSSEQKASKQKAQARKWEQSRLPLSPLPPPLYPLQQKTCKLYSTSRVNLAREASKQTALTQYTWAVTNHPQPNHQELQ